MEIVLLRHQEKEVIAIGLTIDEAPVLVDTLYKELYRTSTDWMARLDAIIRLIADPNLTLVYGWMCLVPIPEYTTSFGI